MSTTPRAPGVTAGVGSPAADADLPASRQPTRLAELLLGAVVLYAWAPPGVPGFLSLGLVAVAALLGLALLRPGATRLGGPGGALGWLAPGLVLLVGYLVLVSISSPDDSISGWPRRAVRLTMVLALLVAVVSGRVHWPSLVRGAALGLVANAVLFVAGVAPAPYGEYLSGFLLDKNQAGLAYAVVTLLMLGLVDERRRQVAVVLVGASLVWLTGSRTSIAALACGLAWIVLRPRLAPAGRVALVVALGVAVQVVENNFARAGVFASRDGSDAFRARIDEASQAKLAGSPFQGLGLGESWVAIGDRQYLFHNSYWAALVEGGWVLLGAYLLLVAAAVGLWRRSPAEHVWVAAEGANLAVLVCALRLGEVFGATAATLALAGGLLGLLAAREARGAPGPAPGAR
ncbi:O-antigen ligase family protein [Phycicoccus sonneratiae]|uniref:ABC transporter permease n=1 Tax=Phycicoccus sonneratiae TaxID=2807628 RepID=A0ABS2CI13_9MICO|nr:ABC transporter permease [Phycicoccus sonneraticus]MBM6399103.1 ABC transporter permease [Phycicoccus sonneraticus]